LCLVAKEYVIATAGITAIAERVAALRANEPHANSSTPEEVESFVIALRAILNGMPPEGLAALPAQEQRYLREAAALQVHAAQDRLPGDRNTAIAILQRLFSLGGVPEPHGRYEGELVGVSTGLLSDPFFEWLTRIYQPWLGKTFDAELHTGDNIFHDNAVSWATGKLGWPDYRVHAGDDPSGTIRVFPFKSYVAPGIEDPNVKVLKIDYNDGKNPLPVRRIVDELVELPGGYCLGKVHMRGLREFRRVAFFGLVPPGFAAEHDSGEPAREERTGRNGATVAT
jgi:hypothetical protein